MKLIIFNLIIKLISSLYTSMWVSLVIAFLFTAFYVFSKTSDMLDCQIKTGKGIRQTLKSVSRAIIRNKHIRRVFLFSFYTAVVLNNTLVNRVIWLHPLEAVLGGWGFFNVILFPHFSIQLVTSNFDVQALENIVMLMPYTFLAIIAFPGWFKRKGYIKGSFIAAGSLSLFIEISQLIFRMGTFQISDLVYNTGGGVLIGLVVKLIVSCHKKFK